MTPFRFGVVTSLLAAVAAQLPAQGVTLAWSASSNVPGALIINLIGPPGLPFLALTDQSGAPQDVLGVRFHLGFTPALLVPLVGTLDRTGQGGSTFAVPADPGLAGAALYHQAVVLDPGAQNGVFRVSNPESSCLFRARTAVTHDFRSLSGFTGSFDATVAGRLQGGPVRHRSVSTVDPQGALFGQPIQTPLSPYGARLQMVYRPQDLGSTGEEELVTGLEWRLFRPLPLAYDAFPRIAIDLGHTDIQPDYSIDPFSALPRFPDSGLTPSFATNYRPGTAGLRVYDGPYTLLASNLQPGGYLPYPALQTPFAYNGTDALLIDILTFPSLTSTGINGGEVSLMVTSSPRPAARALSVGGPGRVIDPSREHTAATSDCAMHDLRVHFARVKTVAQGMFHLGSALAAPDYDTPVVAATTPQGTRHVIEYRGGTTPLGGRVTPWSTDINVADGYAYLQLRVTFYGNPVTDAVPSIDTLVIPSN